MEIIQDARLAPSGRNRQTRRFIVAFLLCNDVVNAYGLSEQPGRRFEEKGE
jgi:hypothetical protein